MAVFARQSKDPSQFPGLKVAELLGGPVFAPAQVVEAAYRIAADESFGQRPE